MTDRPIIFSAPMVRALLEGRKTQTRRLAWKGHAVMLGDDRPQPGHKLVYRNIGSTPVPCQIQESPWQRVQPGDRLWVRESFGGPVMFADEDLILYAATDFDWRDHRGKPCKWRPSIHMPRWASRLTLTVTATKIERLQKISEEDARAEGAMFHDGGGIGHSGWRHDYKDVHANARSSFARLWNELHGPDSWASNPEVVAISFTVHEGNIDNMEPIARAR